MDSSHRSDKARFGSDERRQRHRISSTDEQVRNGERVAELHKRAISVDASESDRKKAKRDATKLEKATGKKGVEELARLPYYANVMIPVELMHTVQVMFFCLHE